MDIIPQHDRTHLKKEEKQQYKIGDLLYFGYYYIYINKDWAQSLQIQNRIKLCSIVLKLLKENLPVGFALKSILAHFQSIFQILLLYIVNTIIVKLCISSKSNIVGVL